MLGTGLAGLVLYPDAEGTGRKPAANSLECRVQTLMAAPAANAPAQRERCAEGVMAAPYTGPEPLHFSVRELEILARIAAGATSVEIAGQLHISVHTVKNHRKNILRKSGCRNAGQLITRCTVLGLV
ncbi:helix-turn-helix transcriptional regulator [Microbulbifer harenosus]|uniref:Helix-turn-helix transcriptional regulator n=1 Tax=Microbulbifer harenosus TaxID=2576840 RepID=A0ABY2UJ18_9GAMM|nr:helix-turn-helix transcriptional regulator [Microbulbifer harenosus]